MVSYPNRNTIFYVYVVLQSVLRVKFFCFFTRMFKRICLLTIILSETFLLSAQNSLSNKPAIVVATYQYGDNPRIKNIEPFAFHLEQVAGVKATVKSYSSVHVLLQAMNKGEVDVAFMNTFGYLMLREQTSTYEISAALHLPDEASSVYKSVILTNQQPGCPTLQHAVANAGDNFLILVSPGSTSGNLVPRLKLASMMKDDPELFFVEVQYAERHDVALQNMLKEKYSLAAFGSEEYYKLGPDTVKVCKLWESPPIQLGPVVCRKELPENIRNSLKKALLELHELNPEALESVKAGWTEAKPADRYFEIEDTYYESLINLAGNRYRAMKIIKSFRGEAQDFFFSAFSTESISARIEFWSVTKLTYFPNANRAR
jgi:phosphonate transport system substrate-binding protein